MAATDFLEEGTDDRSKEDDDDIEDRSHKKLLNAVSSLYRKQRIAAPKRNEPSLQISEFNLTKSGQKKTLAPAELLRGLSSKPIHQKIQSKIHHIRKQVKPLPKPLEKFVSDKITRETGYENVTKDLSKWNATIEHYRAADQLIFPRKGYSPLSMKPERDILGTFSKPTELEMKMSEVLNQSSTIQELNEEAQAEKLTLAQLMQRRNMVAKMRHRESYRIAKAVRQNKIKSKKYHRMLKRDKMRNELKEFELLQKTDPEAALAKLEKVERARAEERISLRHRNGGKWARGLAIRAKYDAEARTQLAENLRKSREITDKVKASMVSDSEEDDGAESNEFEESSDNPWVNSENEVANFLKGYKKYWEEQNKKAEAESDELGGIKKKKESDNDSDNDASEIDSDSDVKEDEVFVASESKPRQPKRKRKWKKNANSGPTEPPSDDLSSSRASTAPTKTSSEPQRVSSNKINHNPGVDKNKKDGVGISSQIRRKLPAKKRKTQATLKKSNKTHVARANAKILARNFEVTESKD